MFIKLGRAAGPQGQMNLGLDNKPGLPLFPLHVPFLSSDQLPRHGLGHIQLQSGQWGAWLGSKREKSSPKEGASSQKGEALGWRSFSCPLHTLLLHPQLFFLSLCFCLPKIWTLLYSVVRPRGFWTLTVVQQKVSWLSSTLGQSCVCSASSQATLISCGGTDTHRPFTKLPSLAADDDRALHQGCHGDHGRHHDFACIFLVLKSPER